MKVNKELCVKVDFASETRHRMTSFRPLEEAKTVSYARVLKMKHDWAKLLWLLEH